MTRTVECAVWCPSCRDVKYTVYRVQASGEGVHTHVREPSGAFDKRCKQCESVLERRPERRMRGLQVANDRRKKR